MYLLYRFQSTHPHGVRQTSSSTDASQTQVSIHAPAWGATPQRLANYCLSIGFNPRTRMGCDGTGNCRGCLSVVSIHAPAWGATSSSHLGLYLGSAFQSTHPHGVRLTGLRWVDIRNLFQSTHPHGVRLPEAHDWDAIEQVSIHAPAWGAT